MAVLSLFGVFIPEILIMIPVYNSLNCKYNLIANLKPGGYFIYYHWYLALENIMLLAKMTAEFYVLYYTWMNMKAKIVKMNQLNLKFELTMYCTICGIS